MQLVLLACALAGAGEGYLRLTFRLLRADFRLGWVERAILGLYASLGVLYIIASLPFPLFYGATVAAVIVLGWLLLLWTELARSGREGLKGLTFPLASLLHEIRRHWLVASILGFSTLFLLGFEVVVMGGVTAPNTYDGSIQVDFLVLLLSRHTVPTTLAPFAPDAGVVYPQGTSVALATSVLIFGWPKIMSPAFLSPLFTALSVPAAYGLGTRLYPSSPTGAREFGLLLALVFALLATWPRLLVAGSYDFLFALPLFLVLLGWLFWLVVSPHIEWKVVVVLALGSGIVASLSAVAAEFFLFVFLVLALFHQPRTLRGLLTTLAQTASTAAVTFAFVARSLWQWGAWWAYPDHVLTETGSGPMVIVVPPPFSPPSAFVGLVDPFLVRPIDVWFSPFPIVKIELILLLAAGLVFPVLMFLRVPRIVTTTLPKPQFAQLMLVAATGVAMIFLIVVVAPSISFLRTFASASRAWEVSILLFMIYTMISVGPLHLAWKRVGDSGLAPGIGDSIQQFHRRFRRSKAPHQKFPSILSLLATLVLVIPLGTGAAVSVITAPSYAESITNQLSNVSQADLSMLQWLGTHLPTCSGVMVAPGSFGQFLPAYSDARLVYPMDPEPTNFSYHRAVAELTAGYLNRTTFADLRALQVTEVLVTGRSNVLWMPFQLHPLATSSAFRLIYALGDGYLFEYTTDAASLSCFPSSSTGTVV